MKRYESPELEIMNINVEDVITTSGVLEDNMTDKG